MRDECSTERAAMRNDASPHATIAFPAWRRQQRWLWQATDDSLSPSCSQVAIMHTAVICLPAGLPGLVPLPPGATTLGSKARAAPSRRRLASHIVAAARGRKARCPAQTPWSIPHQPWTALGQLPDFPSFCRGPAADSRSFTLDASCSSSFMQHLAPPPPPPRPSTRGCRGTAGRRRDGRRAHPGCGQRPPAPRARARPGAASS